MKKEKIKKKTKHASKDELPIAFHDHFYRRLVVVGIVMC